METRTNLAKLVSIFALACGAILLVTPVNSYAQFDHLTCFKAKDAGKFTALVSLDMLQDQFDPTGQCKISGKAKLFCVPTAKTVDEFVVNKVPGTLLPVDGPEPIPDRICYKIKCPKQTIADELVSDQFGSRNLSKLKSNLLCTPAVKGPPPTTTTTLCQPDCAGKNCGDDGCGGSCGTCGVDEICPGSGVCCGIMGASCATGSDCCSSFCAFGLNFCS